MVTGYKINIQDNYFYMLAINNLKFKTITFTMVSQKTKYWGIYLGKDVSGLYTANYKTLLKFLKNI